MSLYILCLVLFAIGIYCLLVKKNLVKKIVGLGIAEYALNLFFILLGYKSGGEAPILSRGLTANSFVDPLPQALILTSIVIGLAVTALMAAITLRLYEKYRTFDINEIRRLKG
ncbi:MAG: NADH-quinone oxidoreductase subunit K [Candidatus Omnitrophica bacterium]|nr:NADH-quinone oxidoreductase subunit K [Candidatus Omnitrophota bacterium]